MAAGPIIRFCDDADLIRFEPDLDEVFPRRKPDGSFLRDWGVQIDNGMRSIERDLRTRRVYAEPFTLGRLGLRSQEHLRDAAAYWALSWIFSALNTIDGTPGGVYGTKAAEYQRLAIDTVQAESSALDYDEGGTGQATENQRPMPAIFVRG